MTVPFFDVYKPKFMKLWDSVDDPLLFPIAYPVVRRYSPLSFEVVKNEQMYKDFSAIVFGRDNSNFSRHIVSAIYCLRHSIVWLSSDSCAPCAKPCSEAECRIYGAWEKLRSCLKSFVEPRS